MSIVLLIVAAVVLFFGFVVFFGAPYLPTLSKQSVQALDMLKLKPNQTLLELGCGDGRILKLAAERGIRCVGYELNPILVVVATVYTWKYRKKVKIIWGNYWKKDWPKAQGIYVFLLDKYMKKLDKKITQRGHKLRLVSIAFQIPDKKPQKQTNGVFLYEYN